jgi:hypothetical protein
MKHPGEETLVLLRYGELEDPGPIERHLADCTDCRAEYERLVATLDAADRLEVPEPPASYGRDVWARLEPRLDATARRGWRAWLGRGLPGASVWTPARLAMAATMLLLLAAAFVAGRVSGRGELAGPIPQPVRERILLVAVGDHLERSQRLLIEILNSEPDERNPLVAQRRRTRAEGLALQNRLYRTTASDRGDLAVAEVLEDLERLLLEIAHADDDGGAALTKLRQRIERNGILLKIRVLGDRARDAEGAVRPPGRQRT